MRYAVPYYEKFKYHDRVEEVIIRYIDQKDKLIQFIKTIDNSKVVIVYIVEPETTFDESGLKLFKSLCEEYKVKVMYDYRYFDAAKLKEYGIPFFFTNKVNNWDLLYGLASFAPTDMYISDELGFDIKNVSDHLHSWQINVRVIPNYAQSAWKDSDSIKKFFIRPEDTQFYEKYVDIFELMCDSAGQANVAYNSYAVKELWFGKLNEIIFGFANEKFDYTFTLDNRTIDKKFPERRLVCCKRCMSGASCHVCNQIAMTGELLRKNDLILRKKKKKE